MVFENLFQKKKKTVEVDGKVVELEPKPVTGIGRLLNFVKTATPQNQQQTNPIFKNALFKSPEQRQAQQPQQQAQRESIPVYQPAQMPQPKKKIAQPSAFKRYIDTVASKHKALDAALKEQGMKESTYDFVKKMTIAAVLLSVVLTVAAMVLFYKIGLSLPVAVILGLLIGAAAFTVGQGVFLDFPTHKGQSASKNIERDILFAARDMIISLRSGMPLFNAITSISTGYGDASKEFAKIVERVQLGTPLEEAIDQVVAQTKSPSFRRFMLQAAVSIKAGADVVTALQSVIDQLSQERIIELRRYGQRLNAIAMFYMLFGIILPSMGIAVITILTTFIAIFTVTPTVLEFTLVFVIFLQIVFLQLVRGSRPVFSL